MPKKLIKSPAKSRVGLVAPSWVSFNKFAVVALTGLVVAFGGYFAVHKSQAANCFSPGSFGCGGGGANQYVSLQSPWNFRCVDFATQTPYNGGIVQTWDCLNQVPQQHWWGYPTGGEWFSLKNANDNMCLDFDTNSNRNGGKVQQWTCNGWANQQFRWIWGTNAYGHTWYALQSRMAPYRCLDLATQTWGNGGIVQQWDCNNQANQKYYQYR